MKATAAELASLRRKLAAARRRDLRTDTEIGGLAKVHPSQVGRICRGEFKTVSYNVVQVCKELGLKLETVATQAGKRDAAWAKLTVRVEQLWDKTPEDAERIARLLDTVAALRAHS